MEKRSFRYYSCIKCHKYYKAYEFDENGIGPRCQHTRPIEETDFFIHEIYPKFKCTCMRHPLQVEEINEIS